ncbi:MAG: metal ABC transporter permease [Bauldia sp.]|nr:metal ABC transporter permease [Bauldia sp.]
MLDDFFFRAILGGVGVAAAAGPLGCFVVWRRMAYFGDTIAHAALLGIALGLLFEVSTTIGVVAVTLAVAGLLLLFERFNRAPSDALLGILAHGALSIGLVVIGMIFWVRVDLLAYLFGDILAVSRTDLLLIWIGAAAILGALVALWRPLFAATVAEDIARAEGMPADLARVAFMLMIALTVAFAMKIVGVLLITSLLIIPAATASRFARTPEKMAVLAALIGALAVIAGLYLSDGLDTPAGPSIVVAAFTFFLLAQLPLPRSSRS